MYCAESEVLRDMNSLRPQGDSAASAPLSQRTGTEVEEQSRVDYSDSGY